MSLAKLGGFQTAATGVGLLSAKRNVKYEQKKTSILEEIEQRITDQIKSAMSEVKAAKASEDNELFGS
jgi:hypothetical protein